MSCTELSHAQPGSFVYHLTHPHLLPSPPSPRREAGAPTAPSRQGFLPLGGTEVSSEQGGKVQLWGESALGSGVGGIDPDHLLLIVWGP